MPSATTNSSRTAPVHFFSHGSTMMLGEESDSATYWKRCGDEARANGIEHVVLMVGSILFTNFLQTNQLKKIGRPLGSSQ